MIKTVTLTGSEVKVTDLGGQNAAVKNLGSGSIYVSTKPNITAGADNVIEILAGAGEVVLDTNGTVYIVGTGKVQCTGTPYAVPNFKLPSSSSGGGGGTSDVTKEYVDAQDTTNLNLAKSYTDNAKSEIQTTIYTLDNTLNTHIADQVKHITAEERTAWNAKAETDTATTTADGLMSAADKGKLDGIAAGANKYTLPTASSSTLGGVKTSSTVTSSSGYTACPIISGVPYYNDTKVTNTLATTTKAYITGTTSSSTNTGTQVFDTGVYLDTTEGQLVATTFKGNLSGNADTATALTSSAGTAHIPVRFSNGKPVAVSEILKYSTGSLPHGDTTISYASGYKYALIFAYCNKNITDVNEVQLQLFTITWVGNMSSTTSYGERTITQSGPHALSFTVTNGDIILHNTGGEYYRYLIIWSN